MNRILWATLLSVVVGAGVAAALAQEAEDDFHRGISLYEQGKLAEAKAAFEAVLQETPEDAVVLTWCGTAALQLGAMPDAIDYLKQALAQDSKSAVAHNNLGNAYAATGQLPQAEEAYRAAIVISPDYFDAHYNLANLKARQDDYDTAYNEYSRALKIRDDADAHINFGHALQQCGETAKAIREYEAAREIAPENVAVLTSLGSLYLRSQHDEAAADAYAEALKLEPDLAEAHLGAGTALHNLGKYPAAAEHLQKAADAAQDDFVAFYNLGLALAAQSKYAEAEAAYRSALAVQPLDANCQTNLG